MGNTPDFLPAQDKAFEAWLQNFATKCALYESELDLTADDLLAIQSFVTVFGTDLDEVDAAKETLKGLVAGKNSDRNDIAADVRALARRFKGITGLSPTILNSLGIVATGTAGPVVTVTNLVVSGCSDGFNTLSWNRNGNSQGTQFIIESSSNGTSNWELVAVTTKVSFEHKDQTPGEQQYYRIKSNRGGSTSNACMPVVVYPNGGESAIQLAA
jgi:hypothetical protein